MNEFKLFTIVNEHTWATLHSKEIEWVYESDSLSDIKVGAKLILSNINYVLQPVSSILSITKNNFFEIIRFTIGDTSYTLLKQIDYDVKLN